MSRDVASEGVLAALSLPQTGIVYDLDPGRFPGMPLWPGHPPFQVMTYRTPHGLHVQGDQAWLASAENTVGLGFVTEVVISGCHSGAHMDALSHITCGSDGHWHGGSTASEALGDFGPLNSDASQLPNIISRGVMVDVAAHLGVERLSRGYAISLDEFLKALESQQTTIRSGDAVLIRTGQMGAWPNVELWEETRGSGITLDVAEWLLNERVGIFGADNEAVEVVPSIVPGNPHPVHIKALVENGVHLLENMYLEELARDNRHEFLFVALPPKITGATASFVRPVAIV